MKQVTVTYTPTTKKETQYGHLITSYIDPENQIIVTDGYHTMDELYMHRHALFCALCKIYDNYITPLSSRITVYKSWKHHDGSSFEGWFIVMMVVKRIVGPPIQISYHLPADWWDKFKVMERETMWEWDGHNSNEVLKRLVEL